MFTLSRSLMVGRFAMMAVASPYAARAAGVTTIHRAALEWGIEQQKIPEEDAPT